MSNIKNGKGAKTLPDIIQQKCLYTIIFIIQISFDLNDSQRSPMGVKCLPPNQTVTKFIDITLIV